MSIGVVRGLLAAASGFVLAVAPGSAWSADLPEAAPAASVLSSSPFGPPSSFSAGPVIGLDGAGFQVGYRHQSGFGGRASVTGITVSRTVTAGALSTKLSGSVVMGTAMLDWYPLPASGWRVSAGLSAGRQFAKATARANGAGAFNIGGFDYDVDTQISSVTGKVRYNAVAPVLTVGYEGRPFEGLPLLVSIDTGVAFRGKPKVTMTATGPMAGDADFQADLEKQRVDLKRKVDNLSVMPVLRIAASYAF